LGGFFAVAIVGVNGEGDLLDRYVGGEFVLEAVGVDEKAIVFFF
jgi:hypothetical protein